MQKEVPWLWAPNSLFVVAAGNNCAGGLKADGLLFASQNSYDKPYLVVAAIGASQKTKAIYSNTSPTHVDLFAQGSCLCGYGSNYLNGTSQATPLVSMAALLVSDRHPDFEPLDVKWRLIASSDLDNADYAFTNSIGGALNTQRALEDKLMIRKKDGPWRELKAVSTEGGRLQDALGMSSNSTKVLRFRHVDCTNPDYPTQACFQRFVHSRQPEPMAYLNGDTDLLVETLQGTIDRMKLSELEDLQFPIRQNRTQARISSCKFGESNCN